MMARKYYYLLALIPLAAIGLYVIELRGLLLYTPLDWRTAVRTSSLLVGGMLGAVMAALLAVVFFFIDLLRHSRRRR